MSSTHTRARYRRALLVMATAVSSLLIANVAFARRTGIAAASCDGCHGSGMSTDVKIALSPAAFEPGDTVTTTITINALSGGSGGFYMQANRGRFAAVQGQSTKILSDLEVVHSAPKAASGGTVTFQLQWTAPSEPNGVLFQVWALAANGNGSQSGDAPGQANASAVFGCTGTRYYEDWDRDGFGDADALSLLQCGPVEGFAAEVGDCDQNDGMIHPGAAEQCNNRDDDCDGSVDEGLSSGAMTLYEDKDGDGYGILDGETKTVTGCMKVAGFSPGRGDCDDRNPAMHPGANDVCNLFDDDCDTRVDEGVRPRCGIGWCERLSPTCAMEDCVPGEPVAERCNALDDDCDGSVDNGESLCGAGMVCRGGRCSEGTEPAGAGASAGGSSGTFGGSMSQNVAG
ncbi:MAG TPA: choice-of-anchor V domain-containing protein, partial [Polyangiaceae bacterium]